MPMAIGLWAAPWACDVTRPPFVPPEPPLSPPPVSSLPPVSSPPPVAAAPRTGATAVTPPPTYRPKTLEQPAPRATLAPPPPAPAVRAMSLPDEVIVRAIDRGQPAFLRCFRRALDADPALGALKVRVRLDIDATGAVVAATSDAEDPKLARCLAVVAYSLPFPAPGAPALVELPLFFRGS